MRKPRFNKDSRDLRHGELNESCSAQNQVVTNIPRKPIRLWTDIQRQKLASALYDHRETILPIGPREQIFQRGL